MHLQGTDFALPFRSMIGHLTARLWTSQFPNVPGAVRSWWRRMSKVERCNPPNMIERLQTWGVASSAQGITSEQWFGKGMGLGFHESLPLGQSIWSQKNSVVCFNLRMVSNHGLYCTWLLDADVNIDIMLPDSDRGGCCCRDRQVSIYTVIMSSWHVKIWHDFSTFYLGPSF